MKNVTTYVGIDAHKKDLFVAMLIGNEKTPVTWQLPNEPRAVHRLVRKLERATPGPIRVVYEAGPCGFGVYRGLIGRGHGCWVVAPSNTPPIAPSCV